MSLHSAAALCRPLRPVREMIQRFEAKAEPEPSPPPKAWIKQHHRATEAKAID